VKLADDIFSRMIRIFSLSMPLDAGGSCVRQTFSVGHHYPVIGHLIKSQFSPRRKIVKFSNAPDRNDANKSSSIQTILLLGERILVKCLGLWLSIYEFSFSHHAAIALAARTTDRSLSGC